MKIEIVNHSRQRILSALFLKKWIRLIVRELQSRKIGRVQLKKNLTVAFLTETEMKKLNRAFRGKNKVTDVLSFFSDEKDHLGELALCPKYIKKQMTQGKYFPRKEVSFLVLHGLLHLLGFDHEKSKKQAQRMFHLQDQIFNKCWK